MRQLHRKYTPQLRNGKCYFISLHIDAYGSGNWSGSHVCYQKERAIPDLARAIAARIELYGCPRCKDEEPYGSSMSARNLGVLRDNTIQQAVLLEMAIPANSGDSYRIRSDENRRRYLAAVVLSALIDLQAEQPLSQYAQNQTNELIRQQFGTLEPNPTPADEIEQPSSMSSRAWHWILGFTGFAAILGSWRLLFIAPLIALGVSYALMWLFDKHTKHADLTDVATSTALLLFLGTTVLFGSRLWCVYFTVGVWVCGQDCHQNGFRRYSGAWTHNLLTMYLAPIGLVAIHIMDTIVFFRKTIVKWRSR